SSTSNAPSTTTHCTLSLHDALPIFNTMRQSEQDLLKRVADADNDCHSLKQHIEALSAKATAYAEEENQLRMRLVNFEAAEEDQRSEEHTSELQSRSDLVCRLLLEKK